MTIIYTGANKAGGKEMTEIDRTMEWLKQRMIIRHTHEEEYIRFAIMDYHERMSSKLAELG